MNGADRRSFLQQAALAGLLSTMSTAAFGQAASARVKVEKARVRPLGQTIATSPIV